MVLDGAVRRGHPTAFIKRSSTRRQHAATAPIREDYLQPQVRLNYDPAGNRGLEGFDRFGRVVRQLWEQYDGDDWSAIDDYKYTYDSAGNRTSRQNVLADTASKKLSETYAYDEVYRLIGTDRGHFDQGTFVKERDFQDWTLDGLGNFGEFKEDSDTQQPGWETDQDRTVNAANEIQTISGGWIAPQYDRAGNMISGPAPGDESTRLHFTYDAWNRLVCPDPSTFA